LSGSFFTKSVIKFGSENKGCARKGQVSRHVNTRIT
jgi:hypothetical protein